jgi:predicted peptidase
MGAGQAIAAATRSPERYAAVAALGGGGAVANGRDLANLPVFVGVGTEDFALRGARGLAENLRKANAQRLSFHEYPSIEHLAIVQVALPDVFAFLDQIVAPHP